MAKRQELYIKSYVVVLIRTICPRQFQVLNAITPHLKLCFTNSYDLTLIHRMPANEPNRLTLQYKALPFSVPSKTARQDPKNKNAGTVINLEIFSVSA